MKNRRMLRILKVVTIALVALGALGLVTMGLWNWLMPAVFGLRAITFWQALGLWVLARLLLGGFHGRGPKDRRWRARLIERWEQMSPEERERFRNGLRHRWGGCEGAEKSA